MANNKVELADGSVLMDITDTTATAGDVVSGKTFYAANGTKTTGSASIPAPATAVPIKDGTGAVGSSLKYAREDHVHPLGDTVQAGIMEILNPHSPNDKKILIDRLENAFYFADKRFTVTGYIEDIESGEQTALTASQCATPFDMSESRIDVPDGKKLVMTIDFGSPDGVYPNYPYGTLCLGFYYTGKPKGVSGRVYGKHTGSTWYWQDLSFTLVSNGNTKHQYRANLMMYNMQKIEVTIIGDTTSTDPYKAALMQIAYYLSRTDKNKDMPYFSKLRAEELYYPVTAPDFVIDGKGSIKNNYYTKTEVEAYVGSHSSSWTPLDAYPIGSIYQSMDPTSPAELFGGYWNPIKGQFILAAAEASDIGTEPDLSVCYRTAGTTGGSERVTLSEAQMPAHTHGRKSLTGHTSVRPLSNKSSSIFSGSNGIVTIPRSSGTFTGGLNYTGIDATKGWNINVDASHEHNSVGGGESHGNMPPYIAAYTWVRVEPPEELGA